MKTIRLFISTLIFALGALFFGCASSYDAPPEANTSIGNRQPVRADSNAAQILETPAAAAPKSAATTQQNNSAPAAAPAESTKVPNESPVTMESFNKLKTGMSYKEAASILGSRGLPTGEFKTQSGSMAMYSWKGKGESGDWNVTARFDNGKLVNKVQAGLR